jgi:predicted nucleic acid-binding protein
MAEYVLDPAVAMKWFLPTGQESYVAESRGLLDRIARGADTAHVPGVFFYEFGAWLHAEGGRFGIDPERAFEAVRALPLVEHALDRELAAAGHLAARRHALDFYTAVYIALSERLVCPFLTGDDALAAKLAGQTRVQKLAGAR